MTNNVRFSLRKGLLFGLATLTLAACSPDGRLDAIYDPSATTPITARLDVTLEENDVEAAKEFKKFRDGLSTGYGALAADEYAESDYGDGDAYTSKAAGSLTGALPPLPYDPANWMLTVNDANELVSARERLMEMVLAGSVFYTGAATAEAQVAYDCWVQEAEENFQRKDINTCRARFEDAMLRVKVRPAPAPAEPIVYEQEAPEVVEVTKPETFIVYFPFNQSNILPREDQTIQEAATFAMDYGTTDVRVGGYADRSGSASYNDQLSQRRAEAVVMRLRELGVPAVLVKSTAYGETNLQRQTADGVREQANRRATISVYFD